MNKYIPLSVPNLKGNELKYITKAVESEWVSSGGKFIDDFENVTAEYVGAKGAVACQSGTAGLHLALILGNIQKGEGVIVPALTFIAAVNPVKYINAVPFFMDCDDSLCMDINKVERFCEEECIFENDMLIHKKSKIHIKAMIVVHVFGNMADMEKALKVAKKFKLFLIEDSTEALGSYIETGELKGKFAGTIGDVGVYSYNGNKIITTGGGGMLVSDNIEFLKRAKYLSTQAKDDSLYYIHNNIGYNYRMTNLQAAIGLGQMEQLETFIEIKRYNYFEYIKNEIPLIKFRSNIRPNYWFYSFISEDRDMLIRKLSQNKIQSRPVWNLICDLKPYSMEYRYKIEKAENYLKKIVNIPCSTNLSKEDIKYVSDIIKRLK